MKNDYNMLWDYDICAFGLSFLWGGRIMAKYILTDWKGCDMYGDKPHVHIFKNKDELIQKLLGYLDDDIILEVVK